MTFVITEPCIDTQDKSCVGECPVDCIYEGERMMYIHPEECIDCGACVDTCPVSAIFMDYDIKGDDVRWKVAAETLFEPLGMLGGAKRHGPLHVDVPLVSEVKPL